MKLKVKDRIEGAFGYSGKIVMEMKMRIVIEIEWKRKVIHLFSCNFKNSLEWNMNIFMLTNLPLCYI